MALPLHESIICSNEGDDEPMRILPVICLAIILAIPFLANAQEPRAELFGGYSYLRVTEGEGANLNGWNISVTANANRWAGIVMDVGGHYGNRFVLVTGPLGQTASVQADAKVHSFMAGPRLFFRELPMFVPFVHGLFGISWANVDGSATFGPNTVEFSETQNAFAMGFGGGVDAQLLEGIALRLIQAEYVQTQFGDDTQNNARISFGVVVHLGSL
jgi:opacity protein-like surface antigen